MSLLLSILLYGAIFIVTCFVLLVVFVWIAIPQVEKVVWSLPFRKWLTLDECVEMGISRFWCAFTVWVMHPKRFDVELLPNLPEGVEKEIEEVGLEPFTVKYHKFRITWRGRPRRRRRRWLHDLLPDFNPAPAPT